MNSRAGCSSEKQSFAICLIGIIGEDVCFGERNFVWNSKGQLISKTNCQAKDSSKKRTNEFVRMRSVFVRFWEESSARKKKFQDYLTFRNTLNLKRLRYSTQICMAKLPSNCHQKTDLLIMVP